MVLRTTDTAPQIIALGNKSLDKGYSSVADILNDKWLNARAAAADMAVDDYVNLQTKKLIATKGLLDQPVTVMMEGREVQLKHPVSGNPLCFGDFVTDRSGPRCGGFLNESMAEELLIENPEQTAKVNAHIERVKKQFPDAPDSVLQESASTLRQKLAVQRKLSDFDFQATNLNLLTKSIAVAYKEEHGGQEIPPHLQAEVARAAWLYGGNVREENITAADQGTAQTYLECLRHDLQSEHASYHHMLLQCNDAIKELVKDSPLEGQTEFIITTKYGPKTALHAPEIIHDKASGQFTAKKPVEYFDVIHNANYMLSQVFDKNRDDIAFLRDASFLTSPSPEGIPKNPDTITFEHLSPLVKSALARQTGPLDIRKLSEDIQTHIQIEAMLGNHSLEENHTAEKLAALYRQYQEPHTLAQSAIHHEEMINKLALMFRQSDDNETGKVVTSASDLKALHDLEHKQHEGKNAEHAAIIKGSNALILLPLLAKWGINPDNIDRIGNELEGNGIGAGLGSGNIGANGLSEGAFDYDKFRASIHTYGLEGGVRQEMGWHNLTNSQIDTLRETFASGIQPYMEFVKSPENRPFFERASILQERYQNFVEADQQLTEIRKEALDAKAASGMDRTALREALMARNAAQYDYYTSRHQFNAEINQIMENSPELNALRNALQNGAEQGREWNAFKQTMQQESFQALLFNNDREHYKAQAQTKEQAHQQEMEQEREQSTNKQVAAAILHAPENITSAILGSNRAQASYTIPGIQEPAIIQQVNAAREALHETGATTDSRNADAAAAPERKTTLREFAELMSLGEVEKVREILASTASGPTQQETQQPRR